MFLLKLMPSRSRVLVYLPEEKLEQLKNWAKKENRPVSNLAATIILRALEEIGEDESPPQQDKPAKGKGNGTNRRGKAGGEE